MRKSNSRKKIIIKQWALHTVLFFFFFASNHFHRWGLDKAAKFHKYMKYMVNDDAEDDSIRRNMKRTENMLKHVPFRSRCAFGAMSVNAWWWHDDDDDDDDCVRFLKRWNCGIIVVTMPYDARPSDQSVCRMTNIERTPVSYIHTSLIFWNGIIWSLI